MAFHGAANHTECFMLTFCTICGTSSWHFMYVSWSWSGSDHRPRLCFDIRKRDAVFYWRFSSCVCGDETRSRRPKPNHRNLHWASLPTFISDDLVVDALKHWGRFLVVKTSLWFYSVVKTTSSHSTGTEMSVMDSKQRWHKHLLTKHTNTHNGKHITHRQRPLRPPATRRRNRTDKRAINHFSGFKKNTHKNKNTSRLLQHLSIISTVSGGGGLSRVAPSNEY